MTEIRIDCCENIDPFTLVFGASVRQLKKEINKSRENAITAGKCRVDGYLYNGNSISENCKRAALADVLAGRRAHQHSCKGRRCPTTKFVLSHPISPWHSLTSSATCYNARLVTIAPSSVLLCSPCQRHVKESLAWSTGITLYLINSIS